ncbi:MAG: ABC transporter ATP-binding protein/permease [Parvularculaceae bacterium]|nr:ABC transporter ATP-binding protein/permease [Parvularculaceae bacterium]
MPKGRALQHRADLQEPGSTVKLAWRIWRDYLGRYKGRLAAALLAMAVFAASSSLFPIGVEQINAAFMGRPARIALDAKAVVFWGPILVVGLGVVNALAQYVQANLSQTAALAAIRDIQRDMFRSLMNQDYAQVREDASGRTASTFTNDLGVLRETLNRALAAIRDGLTFVALCAVMAWYDVVLFLAVIFVYALIGWPIARIGKHLRRSSAAAQAQAGDLNALVGETLVGARVVKTYALEGYETRRADRAFDDRFAVLARMTRLRSLNEPIIFMIGAVAVAIVVGVGAWRINVGALRAEEFVAFVVALLLLSQPARGLSALNASVQEGFAAFERAARIIDTAPAVRDRADATPLVVGEGRIVFRDVVFAYDGKARALDGFSLDVPAGKTVALVGESGAGKSTLFHVLPRLYDLDAGRIEIDERDIAGATIASLRAHIAVVGQEAFLFDDTIAANIALGREGATTAEIEAAAEGAAIDDFIRTLPDGYQTRVGEGGARLSGGQRQRIAIARAFLKDAPILLLDEATSALDAESEARVQAAVERLARGRTVLVIAHRLATVVKADLIAVVDKGRVVEQGTHDALLAKGGLYARLARLQFSA